MKNMNQIQHALILVTIIVAIYYAHSHYGQKDNSSLENSIKRIHNNIIRQRMHAKTGGF